MLGPGGQWENEAYMWRLYKPRAGHTSETAVIHVSSVSPVAFLSQEHEAALSHLTLFSLTTLSLSFPLVFPLYIAWSNKAM